MKIAIVSSTTIPACLPDDKYNITTYGSEMYNAVLCKALAERNEIEWYAPAGSSSFSPETRIRYHAIKDSKGAHLPDERLELISYDGSKTTDILDCDFLIDMSKQNHVTEELAQYHDFTKYVNYKSGYQDWHTPWRVNPHFVTHCQYFADNFKKAGKEADVCRFGLPDFWTPVKDSETTDWVQDQMKLDMCGYFLFPHRPNREKGLYTLIALARAFPGQTFVISTAAVFADHIAEMANVKQMCSSLPNVRFISCPQNFKYHYYRRALMQNARAVLSCFAAGDIQYMDTGGLVSFEAIRCGTPVIVTRSPGSTEMLGELEDKGVIFVDGGGYDGVKNVVKYAHYDPPSVTSTSFMPVSRFVEDYETVMKKYE